MFDIMGDSLPSLRSPNVFLCILGLSLLEAVKGEVFPTAYCEMPRDSGSIEEQQPQQQQQAQQQHLSNSYDRLAIQNIRGGFTPFTNSLLPTSVETQFTSPTKHYSSLNFVADDMPSNYIKYEVKTTNVDTSSESNASGAVSTSKASTDPDLTAKATAQASYFAGNSNSSTVVRHYACPPTTLEALRKRYGHRRSVWGEWSNREARQFYRTQLPRALQSKFFSFLRPLLVVKLKSNLKAILTY